MFRSMGLPPVMTRQLASISSDHRVFEYLDKIQVLISERLPQIDFIDWVKLFLMSYDVSIDRKTQIIVFRMPTNEVDNAVLILRRIPRVIYSIDAFRDRIFIDISSLVYSLYFITHRSIEDGEAVSAQHTERREVKDSR